MQVRVCVWRGGMCEGVRVCAYGAEMRVCLEVCVLCV